MNNDVISRSALLELAHNHVGGTVDCNDIARFPAVDVVPMDFHERCLELEVKKRIAAEKTARQCIENYLPVRHGRWILEACGFDMYQRTTDCVFRCSECGLRAAKKYPYCHCGAKMMDGDNGA